MSEFQVHAELLGHEGAVRAIAVSDDGSRMITGAMDSALKTWALVDSVWIETATSYDHEHWVTSSLWIPAGVLPDCPEGAFATGSMDKRIRIFSPKGERMAVLEGHEGGVISLALSSCKKHLLSGSWDGTCRVWDLRSQACLYVLDDHENGVCVLGLPNGVIVTGSTGKQVGNAVTGFQLRFWHDFKLKNSIADHDGPIRQLALIPELGFVSCSNDGSLKVRSMDGDLLATMAHPLNAEGKPGFVLGVGVLADGRLVSASEDCTARVWAQDGSLLQTVDHPGGLWCVTPLPNGDFVTGCDDKIARIFTNDLSRVSAEAVVSLDQAVQEAKLVQARGPSGVEIDRLPDYEQRIHKTGNSDGQIQMFRRGKKAFACQWNAPSRSWLDIGEVTGTGSGGTVDGVAYDMVIPVEIEMPGAGLQKLELGYNQGQNPFMVAQEFINKHMLDQAYLKEIADYISQRAGDYQAPVIGQDGDVAMDTAVPAPTYKYFPVVGYNTFETTKIGKLLTTLQQFNEHVQAALVGATLTDVNFASLEALIQTLQDTAFYHSSTVSAEQIRIVMIMLSQWPVEFAFPALDLLRLVVVHPQGVNALQEAGALDGPFLLHILDRALTADSNLPMACRMLALRVLANLFLHPAGRNAFISQHPEILKRLPSFITYTTQKTVALSFATVLLNFARLHVESPEILSKEDRVVLFSLVFQLLNAASATSLVQEYGEDTVLRALIAVGTLTLDADSELKELVKTQLAIFVAGNGRHLEASPVLVECLQELKQSSSS